MGCFQSEKLAAEISHGERRLLELALAMATNPILLLLDEPMAGAGIEESRHIASIIEAQKSNHAILLIEHDMNAVFQLADRITVLEKVRPLQVEHQMKSATILGAQRLSWRRRRYADSG